MKKTLSLVSAFSLLFQPAAFADQNKSLKDGFELLLMRDDDQPVQSAVRFKGLYEFNAAAKPGDKEEPWLGLDLTNKEDAWKLAIRVQKYVYEGWFDNADPQNTDNHFQKNGLRSWCSTPWLNTILEKGRDAVHGLTKEFPLSPEAIENYYPGINIKKYAKTSWGTAFFNKPNCDMYGQIFGTPNAPKDPSKNLNAIRTLADGAVSFKLLFSTVSPDEYAPFAGAYLWNAHVSSQSTPPQVKKAKPRQMQVMPHLQMDVAIKDTRLKGLKKGQKAQSDEDVIPWIMLTYYFDPSYNSEEANALLGQVKNLPEQLKKMRPMGIQYGLDRGQSVVFEKAVNNHEVNDQEFLEQFPPTHNFSANLGERLNGPADNPKSSCLGCHALAIPENDPVMVNGKKIGVSPGVLTNHAFNSFVKKNPETSQPRFNYDFNQQVRIAIESYTEWMEQEK